MNDTKIKICGLFRRRDADYINQALPDYAGFIFYDKSRRYVTPIQADFLRKKINPAIKTVGVFVNEDLNQIKYLYENKTIDIVQLHGKEDETYIKELRALLPNAEIWKAFLIRSAKDLMEAKESSADMVLLDNGYGTGECFDWSLIGDDFSRPLILAGGLTPDNIPEAIAKFHPYAVDISSGVETDQVKNKDKIIAAVNATK
jgi:phosphoribosylanthranilate isomerase